MSKYNTVVLFEKGDDHLVVPNFKKSEFDCKCGLCHYTFLNMHLAYCLRALRYHVEKPIIINSGYRCPSHNKDVGGTEWSQHMIGNAIDITCPSIDIEELFRLAKHYFHKVVLYKDKNFIHCEG